LAGEQQLPWKRLSAEAAAIVGSILLAFWIDAWWEERQDRAEEREVLLALRAELEYNIEQIDLSLEFQRLLLEPTVTLLNVAADRSEISVEDLEQLLGTIYYVHTTELATGVFQSLAQGGQFSLIKQRELSSQIAALMTSYEEMLSIEGFRVSTYANEFTPYLADKVNSTRIINTTPVKPTESERRYPQMPEVPIETQVEIMADPLFHDILTKLYTDHYDAIFSLNKTKSALVSLIGNLNDYLASG